MRIVVDARLGVGNAHLPQQCQDPLANIAARQVGVHSQHFADLPADAVQRVERGHRILEDHADAGAADPAHAGLVELHQVATAEEDLATELEARVDCG